MTQLPPGGRDGAVPPWPLGDDVRLAARLMAARERVERLVVQAENAVLDGRDPDTIEDRLETARTNVEILRATIGLQAGAEAELWCSLWATPQAEQWQRLRWDREVAQYVRWKVHAEAGDLAAAKEARQLADRLGLNPLALLRLRWAIDDAPAAPEATEATTSNGLDDLYA